MINVLFVCTGNSARSILAEAILNNIGKGKFEAYSAGSKPLGKVNPFALKQLKLQGINDEWSSKNWDIFSGDHAPIIDLVITVCDNAANEVCPKFVNKSLSIHWGLKDPAAVNGSDENKQKAFNKTYVDLKNRLEKLVAVEFDEQILNIEKVCNNIHINK